RAHRHAVDTHRVAVHQAIRIGEGGLKFVGAGKKRNVLEVADAEEQDEERYDDRDAHLKLVAVFHVVMVLGAAVCNSGSTHGLGCRSGTRWLSQKRGASRRPSGAVRRWCPPSASGP